MLEGSADATDVPGVASHLTPRRPDAAGPDEHHEKLVDLQAPLRRFVSSRVHDAHLVDDIVQETMLRMLQVAPRLEVEALGAYAFTVARNLIVAGARSEATARRNLPRLVDRHEPVRPDTAVTDAEARRALGVALAKVTPAVRHQLLARDVDRRPLHEVAVESDVSSGVLASQLHRTRARLRVDYLLSLRQVKLPSAACQKVLVAISAADRRRQASLQAGQHLDDCPVCSELSLPLVSRDHALAGWAPVPLIALGSLHGHLTRLFGAHPKASVAASTGVAVAAAAVAAGAVYGSTVPAAAPGGLAARPGQTVTVTVPSATPPTRNEPVLASGTPTTPASRPTPDASTALRAAGADVPAPPLVPDVSHLGRPVIADALHLRPLSGRNVRAEGVVVLEVPADEGFWVGGDEARVWVNLAGAGESPVQIRTGQRLSFTGVVTANTASFLAKSGPVKDDGLDTLRRQQFHVRVDPSSIQVQ